MIQVLPDDTGPEPTTDEAGLGALHTERGNLPLGAVDAQVAITGLVARTTLIQVFRNPHPVPLEATYIFPLPDRAAVTALRLIADDRVVQAELKERDAARADYDAALAEGRRAAIAEEERPDVFTMRVGNIVPGESVRVELTLTGPLSYADGEATFRLPLVVAPRYLPGAPLDGPGAAGAGTADDTDAGPDASRITPPVLLPGFPNPVRLSIVATIDPAGLPLGEVHSSLPTTTEGDTVTVRPGQRLDQDFILRLSYGEPTATVPALTLHPDAQGEEGTFRLTLLPPTDRGDARPRDVVLLLDRSGSMRGWKMVAARRAAARIVDTLTATDRFAVLAFDTVIETPESLPAGLVAATDRNRWRAVEHLSRMDSRGGTELLEPLQQGLGLLTDATRDRVLVLVTDGQVGNEDQILAATATLTAGVRLHTVGIDRAVNAGFLGRLAAQGGGRCELVESEDRLDTAMASIHRRILAPVVTDLAVRTEGITIIGDTLSPARLPALFSGAPLVLTGRYTGTGTITVTGQHRDGTPFEVTPAATVVDDPAATAVWARAHLLDLADQLAAGHRDLKDRIVATSLRFGVLCRFTAWVAVDTRVVADGGTRHQVIQPVELPSGWEEPGSVIHHVMRLTGARPIVKPKFGRVARAVDSFDDGAGVVEVTAADPGRPIVAPVPPVGNQLAVAPTRVLRPELERLRAAAGEAWFVRREILADLGTRLAALLPGATGELGELVEALRDDRPLALAEAQVEQLWARALAVVGEVLGNQ